MKASTKLSERICEMMARGGAPSARRMPISCVRSLTSTSMMLLTPTMPASSVPSPTNHVSHAMPRKSPITLSNISAVAIVQTAFSSSGEMMWRANTASRHAFSTSLLGVSSRPATASMWIRLPPPYICCASDTGTTAVFSTSLNDMAVLCLRNTPITRK